MLMQSFATLLVLLVAIGAVAWLAPKLRARRDAGPIEVLGRCTLDVGRTVYVVRVGEEALVVAASESAIAVLSKMPLATFAKATNPGSPSNESS